MPKFSVVIPLYNKKNYIKETLISVLKQTFSDFEVIVVDDGSTDESLKQVNDIHDPRLKIFSQKNAGVSDARNKGINKAVGEYIAFLDADDYWHQNYLETINFLTVKYPESDVFVTAYRVLLSQKRINLSSNEDEGIDGCLQSYWKTLKNKYEFVWTSATTIKKEALVNAGLFTPGEKVGEDLDLMARVAQRNPRVAYSTKRCVDYIRYAENNARVSVKVAHPKAYLSVLSYEMENSQRTTDEKECIKFKYDKKMIAYIFTLILSGERGKAKVVTNNWKPGSDRKIYKHMLIIANYMPNIIIKGAFNLRLKVF